MRKLKISLLIAVAGLIQACAAPGPIFEMQTLKENSSILYVYRVKQFKGGGMYPHIYVDGKLQGPLRNGGYLAFDLKPGKHKIEAIGDDWKWDLPAKSVELNSEIGQTYYIRLDYDSKLGVTDSGSDNAQRLWNNSVWIMNYGAGFGPVPESKGSEEIKGLKLSM